MPLVIVVPDPDDGPTLVDAEPWHAGFIVDAGLDVIGGSFGSLDFFDINGDVLLSDIDRTAIPAESSFIILEGSNVGLWLMTDSGPCVRVTDQPIYGGLVLVAFASSAGGALFAGSRMDGDKNQPNEVYRLVYTSEGGGSGDIPFAAGMASAEDLTGMTDPLPFLDIDGNSIPGFSVPLMYLPPGTMMLVPAAQPNEVGLWTWDGSQWSRNAHQPPNGTPVSVFLGGTSLIPGAWVTRNPMSLTPDDEPYVHAQVRTDRPQRWTQPQTTRLPVGLDGDDEVVEFVVMEAVDPNNASNGVAIGKVVAAGLQPAPGLSILAGAVEMGEFNPFSGELSPYRGVVSHSFAGFDVAFSPIFRTSVRRGDASLFEADLAPIYIGDPLYDDDATTKRYVDAAIADAIDDIDSSDPDAPDRMSFRGDWDNATTYSNQDVVLHANGVWVSAEDDLTGVEPGSEDAEDVWVALHDTTAVYTIAPTEGAEGWEWGGTGLTAESIEVPPPYDEIGGGHISYTGNFSNNSLFHSFYVPASRTGGVSGAGSIGFRFTNPGIGRWVDTFIEVLNSSGDYTSFAMHAVLDDGSTQYLGLAPAGKITLWRVTIVGTGDADPTVRIGRISMMNTSAS